MDKYILEKVSVPCRRWEFDCEYDARQELLKWVCEDCLTGERTYFEDGEWVVDEDGFVPDKNDIQDLLATACGCEFEFREENSYE